MKYREFQHLARLFTIGRLDADELEAFATGRMLYGAKAERFLAECQALSLAMALSLPPIPPNPGTKAKLMQEIRKTARARKGLLPGEGDSSPSEVSPLADAFALPLTYEASCRN